jgi:thiol-disulfide isomerase/thioredoxin
MEREEESIPVNKNRKIALSLLFIAILITAIIFSIWYYRSRKSTTVDFKLVDLEGNSFNLSDYRGKIVILDFMAVWCDPCRTQISNLGEIWKKYENEIIIISIDVDPYETPEKLKEFSSQFPYATWLWAKDTANLGYEYKITAIPTMIVVDQDGNIQKRYVGITSSSSLSKEIEHLLE